MPKFYVDFDGWCEIEAETPKQAREEFYRLIREDIPLPSNYYDILGEAEEVKEVI